MFIQSFTKYATFMPLDPHASRRIMSHDMKTKHRKPVEIIADMQRLIEELALAIGENHVLPSAAVNRTAPKLTRFSGASGGIRLLQAEKFFSTPKTRVEVVKRLHQEGFNYTPSVVSVALLRQVRSRELVRLPSAKEGKERWAFAERR
jgi:hypothetical protein